MNPPLKARASRELVDLLERSSGAQRTDINEMGLDERERVKVRLIVETARAIREGASDGFTVRRVANSSETSTQMIYTLFGGKEGLVHALWEASFELLAAKCRELPDDLPPLERLLRLGVLYRQTALDDPVIYDALFGGRLNGLSAPEPNRLRSTEAFSLLVDCVEECVETGALSTEDPEAVAEVLWAVAHGVIDFEIAGYFEKARAGREHFLKAQRAVIRGFGGQDLPEETLDPPPIDG